MNFPTPPLLFEKKLDERRTTSQSGIDTGLFKNDVKGVSEKNEQDYIVKSINKGLEENHNNPFWRYIKTTITEYKPMSQY